MRSYLLGIVIMLVVLGTGTFLLARDGTNMGAGGLPAAVVATGVNVIAASSTDSVASSTATSTVQGTATTTATSTAPAAPKHVVTYTDAGFDPKTITIAQGETVTFENLSAYGMQVFVDAITRGATTTIPKDCDTGVFVECAAASENGSWSYTFDTAGTYNYHNNIDPTRTGTVRVK